ncbi:hypothetical protein Tco_1286057 [Tanacetum coccineum]
MVDEMVDQCLEGNYDRDKMHSIVACTTICLRHATKRRPRMSQNHGDQLKHYNGFQNTVKHGNPASTVASLLRNRYVTKNATSLIFGKNFLVQEISSIEFPEHYFKFCDILIFENFIHVQEISNIYFPEHYFNFATYNELEGRVESKTGILICNAIFGCNLVENGHHELKSLNKETKTMEVSLLRAAKKLLISVVKPDRLDSFHITESLNSLHEMELFKQMQEEEERLAYEQCYRETVTARQQRLGEEAEELDQQR